MCVFLEEEQHFLVVARWVDKHLSGLFFCNVTLYINIFFWEGKRTFCNHETIDTEVTHIGVYDDRVPNNNNHISDGISRVSAKIYE